jgi:hypothetical protein
MKLDHDRLLQQFNETFGSSVFHWLLLFALLVLFLIFASSELIEVPGLSTIRAISEGERPAMSSSLICSRRDRGWSG